MKIHEPLTYMSPQTSNKQKPSPHNLDFERWLDTPTKQSSGDEYYWQHQEQLQQCDLQFDSQPLMSQRQQKNILVHQSQRTNPLTVLQTTDITIKNHRHNVPTKVINQPCLNVTESLEIIMGETPKSSSTIMPYALNNASVNISNNERLEEIKANNDTRTLYTFKNHHLFIQEQEAELTLNNNEMNAQEEKELIHTIKHLLKNKGIILNKLIINGVKHD